MRPAASKSFRTAACESFAFSSVSMENMPLIMVRSAPPEKEDLPEVKTTPLTASSEVVASRICSISSITSTVKTFIDLSFMSQVTSAMPSASVSTVKFL